MALAAMAARTHQHVLAVLVDHGLRPESAHEAAVVQRNLQDMGIDISVRTIKWANQPRTGVQNTARTLRYAHLVDAAYEFGADDVLTGHHADDQLETIVMRIAAASSIHGLSGIPRFEQYQCPISRRTIRLVRPLLDVKKQDLVTYCQSHAIPWVEDPSNLKDVYTRNRVRKALAQLEQHHSVTSSIVAAALSPFASVDNTLREDIINCMLGHVSLGCGSVIVNRSAFAAIGCSLRQMYLLRSLAQLFVSKHPTEKSVQSLLESLLLQNGALVRTQMGGCLVYVASELFYMRLMPKRYEERLANQQSIATLTGALATICGEFAVELSWKPFSDAQGYFLTFCSKSTLNQVIAERALSRLPLPREELLTIPCMLSTTRDYLAFIRGRQMFLLADNGKVEVEHAQSTWIPRQNSLAYELLGDQIHAASNTET